MNARWAELHPDSTRLNHEWRGLLRTARLVDFITLACQLVETVLRRVSFVVFRFSRIINPVFRHVGRLIQFEREMKSDLIYKYWVLLIVEPRYPISN
jgi:hypothetical protein